MGANVSAPCPSGFERGAFFSCTAICPPEFKKVRDRGSQGRMDRCVHRTTNTQSFSLAGVEADNPRLVESERNRVRSEAARVEGLVQEGIQRTRLLNEASDAKRPQVHEYSRIQSELATFRDVSAAAADIRATKSRLRVVRPPTAPASDLEAERVAISEIAKRNLYFIQVALFLVVVVLLGYLVLPSGYAHGIAFLLLCVGISLGFFLRRG